MKVVEGGLGKTTDEALYAQMAHDSISAYNTLFERHWERLYGIAVHILHHREVAKDVIQEVFLSFWENRKSKQVSNVGAYLSRAAKFGALKMLRDDRSDLNETVERAESLFLDQGSALDAEEVRQQITDAVEELPDRCREVFILSRNEQLSNQEIAQKLNISQRTVETHISNALKQLRDRLPKDLLLFALLSSLY